MMREESGIYPTANVRVAWDLSEGRLKLASMKRLEWKREAAAGGRPQTREADAAVGSTKMVYSFRVWREESRLVLFPVFKHVLRPPFSRLLPRCTLALTCNTCLPYLHTNHIMENTVQPVRPKWTGRNTSRPSSAPQPMYKLQLQHLHHHLHPHYHPH